ncbi:hypothetical protein [Ferrimonas balearica]|uniref:hypothetical protein n=1 Tax=Ferrimonas balearica TaxID=44012 RepID=UPI001C9A2998|nr:hypothetical protein [Ferrimonas balearica]MBY5992100.1 hypothetical protein [Ferrimonas balearica]
MAIKNGSKRWLLVLGTAGFLLASGVTVHHLQCHDRALTAQCSTATALNWRNWLVGKSGSSQFHFVDLLELLYGHKERHEPMPNRPGK